MANYEIMLVVSGSLDEKEAKKVADSIANSIKECKPKVHEYGSKQLAYKIKKDTTGYYYQYNFECEKPALINEFRRLSNINKNVLRNLIINLEKDYGYKASVNPKKVARNKKTAEIHAARKAEIEKAKALREAERNGTKVDEEIATTEKPKATRAKKVEKETTEAPAKEKAAKKETKAKTEGSTKKTTAAKSTTKKTTKK